MARLTCVVLAGGRPDAVSALQPEAPNKAFVRVGGVRLVTRTLEALRSSERVGTIVVVAPAETLHDRALELADERRPSGERITDSLRAGLRDLDPAQPVLIVPSDLPVLTRAAIDEFVEAALERRLDVAYAILERGVHEAAFPQIPHTWARLYDGTFCGGGLILIAPRVFPVLERFLERLAAARKNPLRLASLFGPRTVLRYMLGSLTVARLEERASTLLAARAGGVASSRPEIAVNVDRPGDVALAEQLVRKRAGRAPAAS